MHGWRSMEGSKCSDVLREVKVVGNALPEIYVLPKSSSCFVKKKRKNRKKKRKEKLKIHQWWTMEVNGKFIFSVNCRDDVENEEMLKQNSKVWESHVAQLHDVKHAYCLFEKKKKKSPRFIRWRTRKTVLKKVDLCILQLVIFTG